MDEPNVSIAVSLEEPALGNNAPTAPAAETPPAPTQEAVTPPPAPQNTEEGEPEGVINAPTGEKYVPLGAVQAERGKRKEAEKALSAKDQEIASLREKAIKYDEAAQYLAQAKPYIEKAKADLQRQNQPQTPAEQPGPLTSAQAEAYAKRFDLFTTDGKPDVARAQEIAKDHEEQMRRVAQQTVAPLMQNEAQRVSTTLYQQYLNRPEVNGFKIDPKYLANTWNTVPPEMIAANPQIGEVLFRTALATQIMEGGKPIQAPPPVVPTEGVGSGTPREQALSGHSFKFQQASGMKPQDFRDTREKYTPGQPNSLE